MTTKLRLFLTTLFFSCSILSAEISIKVSKNQYNNLEPINGIYPIQIIIEDTNYKPGNEYEVFRYIQGEAEAYKVNGIYSINHDFSLVYYDNSSNLIPETIYEYVVTCNNQTSNRDYGYGALDYKTFFRLYDDHIFKSQAKLVLMNKPKNLEKLGKEKITGNKTGTLSYETKVKGLSGIVLMHYENYSDSPVWIFTGDTNTKANMAGNGSMYGTVQITGMYPGKIVYDNLILKDSAAGGGTYGIQPEGLELKDFDYTIAAKHN